MFFITQLPPITQCVLEEKDNTENKKYFIEGIFFSFFFASLTQYFIFQDKLLPILESVNKEDDALAIILHFVCP